MRVPFTSPKFQLFPGAARGGGYMAGIWAAQGEVPANTLFRRISGKIVKGEGEHPFLSLSLSQINKYSICIYYFLEQECKDPRFHLHPSPTLRIGQASKVFVGLYESTPRGHQNRRWVGGFSWTPGDPGMLAGRLDDPIADSNC
jgi:hypothetical protein